MFQGRAQEAVDFYTVLFPKSRVDQLERWGAAMAGSEEKVKFARLTLGNMALIVNDSPMPHAFSFTPSSSLFVECESEDEIARLAEALAADGAVMMPLNNYGFSRRFAWVSDRFGVSWQLNLA